MVQWFESSHGFADVCPVCRADVPYNIGIRLMRSMDEGCNSSSNNNNNNHHHQDGPRLQSQEGSVSIAEEEEHARLASI